MDSHWNEVYKSNNPETLGWFEPVPTPSLEMIKRCELNPGDGVLDIGAGASTLFDHLLAQGYQNLIAADLSPSALDQIKLRIADNQKKYLHFIVDDITRPNTLPNLKNVKLWHDRALLHFLHEENNIQTYLDTLRQVLIPGGFLIIAAFSLDGAEHCTGLPVRRYNAEMLIDLLGSEFNLLEQQQYTYIQPSGSPRPFIYSRFQRLAQEI